MLVPENQSYYKHTYEEQDDMPAHLKKFSFRTINFHPYHKWQTKQEYGKELLCEHRNQGQ